MEKYELHKKIGEGTYGIVYKAQNKTNRSHVAIKKFKDSDDDEYVRKTALREIRILKQLKHDHIVDLLEVFREDNRIFLVFEQLNRTILDELQGRNDYSGIEPLEAKKIIWQMLKACDFMHSHNIVHRDFKPENMLLSRNGVLKICDFGFARQLTQENIRECVALTEYVSTRWYRAPELLVGTPVYTHSVDVWAIGCIFVELVTGSALFTGDSDFEMVKLIIRMFSGSEKFPEVLRETFARNNLFKNIQLPNDDSETADYENSLETKLSFLQNNAAVSFARECLRMDPGQRPTAEQLMEHDYFNDFRDWFEDEIQTLMEYDTQEMQQGILSKQRESALKTRRIENLLGENPVASQSQPNSNVNMQSQSMSNPFFSNSLNQGQQLIPPSTKEESSYHAPLAPRNSGTPIRESRMANLGGGNNHQQPRKSNGGDNPALLGGQQMQPQQYQQYPIVKQSSFGSVIYDSNRKTRENVIEENRLKQASSLSPTRMIQDMSRQDAAFQQQPALSGTRVNQNTMMPLSQQLQHQSNNHQSSGSYQGMIQKQLPSFNGGTPQASQGAQPQMQQLGGTQVLLNQHQQHSDESKKLYSVVIKEDPAEQLSPTFHAKKGFFQINPQANQPGNVSLNRNSDLYNQKQKTFRERERERLNNESQNSRGRSVTKININFNGESGGNTNIGSNINNPMTSSGTNLNISGGVGTAGASGGSPRQAEDSKFYGSKLYASNSSAISGIQTKKTLQSTNSTSNLETHTGQTTKGAYYPTMRQKQARDSQLLLGLSTIQSSQYHDLHHGVMGIGYSHPSGATITKMQPNKISIPSQSMNFPSLDDDSSKNNINQLSSLIQLHNNSNVTLQNNSKKSIHQPGGGSPATGISPKGIHHQQLLAPSSSSYQFPLQALGQGLTSCSNPAKEQPRLKAMMLRNQSSSSTQPLGHSLTRPMNATNINNAANNSSKQQYNSTISNQQQQQQQQQQLQQHQQSTPASSHGLGVSNHALNENLNIAANQKQFSPDSMVSGIQPKPNVKIVDLQHNLLPFDSGLQGVSQMNSASGAIASNTGQQIISDGGVRIDAQSLKNQLKQGKQDGGNLLMSHQQHYLLQQIQGTSGSGGQHNNNHHQHHHQHHHQLPQSSHSGLINKQQQNLIATPKTPNEIYGVQQKAILHQIFNKGGGVGGPSRSKNMTRHTTPFNQSFGQVTGKMTTAGGSNPKLVTMQQLMAVGEIVQSNSKGQLYKNDQSMQLTDTVKSQLVTTNVVSPSVPGGNRPGINSSGAAIKKNGSMGLGAGMSNYAKYNQNHHMSSQLQQQSSYNNQNGILHQQSIITASLNNGTIKSAHSNNHHQQHQQQILLSQTTTHQNQQQFGAPGSSGGYSAQGMNNSVKAAYGHSGPINKLSPTAGSGSRLSQNPIYSGK